jgi:protein-S-isoprenylcysteine O-methyltransferase Ste14
MPPGDRAGHGRSREMGGRRRGNDADFEGMGRGDKILIAALAVLGVVAMAVILVLSLLSSPEWIQFVLAMVLFAALALGSYRYVITPSGRGQESGSD